VLTGRIREMHERSRASYGARRIHLDLRDEGVRVGRKRVERLMRIAGISGYVKRRKFRTTFSIRGVRVADDLVERDFNPPAPDRLWASDIKYVSTWEGTLYLASVIDCYSRKVVGWSMRSDMQAELVIDAVEMAINRRQPTGQLIHHSDQGGQYVDLVFGQTLRKAGISQSMGSKGDCYDCEPSATASTPPSRRSCSAADRSRPDRTPGQPSSTGSRPGTTRPAATPASGTSRPTSRTTP
jgi:putative transposase